MKIRKLLEANSEEFNKGYRDAIKQMQQILSGNIQDGPKGVSGNGDLPSLPISLPGNSSDQNSNSSEQNDSGETKRRPQVGDTGDKDFQEKENRERLRNRIKQLRDAEGDKRPVTDAEVDKAMDEIHKAPVKNLEKSIIDTALGKNIRRDFNDTIKKVQQDSSEITHLTNYKNFTSLKWDFQDFLSSLVHDEEERSFRRPNRHDSWQVKTANDPIRKGVVSRRITEVPTLRVYFDLSGSWTSNRPRCQNSIKELDRYARDGLIKYTVLAVSNEIVEYKKFTDDYYTTGGGADGDLIIEDILKNKPDNILIMTDSDSNRFTGKYTAPGCVWIVTNPERPCTTVIENIKGSTSTRYYAMKD